MKWSLLALAACASHHAAPPASSPDAPADTAGLTCGSAQSIDAILGHNTSANPAYNRANFPANFGTATWTTQAGATMAIDPDAADLSLNPITPAHVSGVDLHTLIPSRPDLRWFAHVVPWFGQSNHIDIGLDNNTSAYVTALLDDLDRRGFDGLVIDWYGQDSYTDKVTRLIQAQLPMHTRLHLIIMMDKGIANLSQAVLTTQLGYVKSQYFADPAYELDGGKPILMFFGVDAAIGATAMAAVKSASGGDQVWVLEGSGSLGKAYADQAFDWTHDWHAGPSTTDPYNLAGVAAYYHAVAASPKRAFGSMVAGFDGMLTKSVAWSKGKYLPRGDGQCLVQNAQTIDGVIPANVTRMQWVTWSDWEEGTAVEPGVENHVAVTTSLDGTTVRWQITGDETTIDHYEVYASTDGQSAVDLGHVARGTHQLDVAATCASPGMQIAVVAVGVPMIRDHASDWLAYPAT